MFVWRPTPDGLATECDRHPEVGAFPKGHECPRCTVDPPPDEDENPSRAPRAPDMPSVLSHERWYIDVSDQFIAEAKRQLVDGRPTGKGKRKKVRKANPLTAAKLADVAIKARRAAVDVARWREDWENVEKLERELAELRRVRGTN